MGKIVTPLTDRKLMQAVPAAKPRKLFDGGGLYIEVAPSGTKTWRMKFSDVHGRESRLTFGNYPDVSIELARTRRADVHQLLKQGLDPRRDFNQAKMRAQMRVGERRLLPLSIDRLKVERCARQVGRAAVEHIENLVFPAVERLAFAGVSRDDIAALFRQIRTERGVEVMNLLYDICVEITWSCLDYGMQKDNLIEAMTDARLKQRRCK